MTSNVRGLTRVALLALAACFLSAACEDDTPAPAPAPAPAPPPAPEPEPEPEPMVEDSAMAMRWWNTLDGPQMVAALHGDEATEEQSAAAMMMYADLDADTKTRVNDTAAELYGEGGHMSVGA